MALRQGTGTVQAASPYDAKGLPTAVLGKTGAVVPRMAVGTGSQFCLIKDEDEATELLVHALDHGLYYWDTAHVYVYDGIVSESRLGRVVKHRRDEIFLSTKVTTREPEQAKRDIELSLKRLETDHVDILKIHSIESVEDAEAIGERGGLVDVLRQMKDEGVAKNIGFSGHASADAMALVAKRYDLDTMLCALNHYDETGAQQFETAAQPVAAAQGLGVCVMKVVRPRQSVKGVEAADLIRYALSLEHPTAAVVSNNSLDILKANIEILRNFTPMNADEKKAMRITLAPFFRHEGLPWMDPGYRDGMMA
jgi:predicted aldo/keto reductase-like oxidoreductase